MDRGEIGNNVDERNCNDFGARCRRFMNTWLVRAIHGMGTGLGGTDTREHGRRE